MARLESKSEQVAPGGEQQMISLYEDFGWTLQSSQEVVDNYLSSSIGGGTIYQNRKKYVKLMFQRDRDMPNYQEIVRLENQYNHEYSILPSTKTAKVGPEILMLFILPLLPIGIIILLTKKKKIEKKRAAGYAKIQPLREKARTLV